MPRNVVYSTWLWQFTKPGMMMAWPEVGRTWRPDTRATSRGAGPTARMRPPDTATPPSGSDGRGHREDPVGAVDRDVAVGFGHVTTLSARESQSGPRTWEYRGAVPHSGKQAAPLTGPASRRYTARHQRREGRSVQQGQGPSISPDVVTSAVWDAVRELPGVCDLYRNPLAEPR